MKKILVSLLFITLTLCCFWSCEKDDICADGTATTPSLIITMYNLDNQTEKKSGNIEYFMEDDVTRVIEAGITDSLVVPLRTDAEIVRWGFTLVTTGSGGTSNYNTDYIEFKYTHNEIYVSRACGYKSLFYLNENTPGNLNPVLTDTLPNDNLWIRDVVITRNNIEDEQSAHVKIYF
ncbi:hypothetical protein E0W68_12240 [Flavobacterium salilacus subsp. salilacus]|uniref:DUF6452 family protein n=1 Tax=Flavobacterium TaxID=237 RepID=UPI001074F4CF|nr:MULTISPECIES: DUF6452 family protein [Flavobacterium]KAF2516296.1 hypothetical protein E0W68_12240 [Flavobacterium salilacus subsp. salilacus]MBE1613826.1 hypothetical protein [Flavobacterium sp. SaA2.13]